MSRLRELRRSQGRTIAELAMRLGVSEATVRNWERGRHLPQSAKVRRKIARVLRVSESELGLGPASIPEPTPPAEVRPSIAVAIIVRDRHVLLTRRRFREGSLVWGFPTGEVEAGETPEDAAVREVGEEVGLHVVAERRLGERVHPVTKRYLVYVACGQVSGKLEWKDHEELAEVEWSDLDDLAERIPAGQLFPPVQQYLEDVLVTA